MHFVSEISDILNNLTALLNHLYKLSVLNTLGRDEFTLILRVAYSTMSRNYISDLRFQTDPDVRGTLLPLAATGVTMVAYHC